MNWKNVGLKVIQHVMNNNISKEKEALDIGKFLLHNKLEDVKTEEEQYRPTLQECKEIITYSEYYGIAK